MDGAGNVHVADGGSGGSFFFQGGVTGTIRKVTPGALVTTIAGLASPGSRDGIGSAASFNVPSGVALDSVGNVYVADQNNGTIRKITPTGSVSTLAGLAGNFGSDDGEGDAARFYSPSGVAVDGSGNVYVADQNNHTIRKITPTGFVSTLAGLAGNPGNDDGEGDAARFNSPFGVAVDGSGNVYVADTYNSTIRKINPAGSVSTLAGLAGNPGSDDGDPSTARFNFPSGVAADNAGTIYVADPGNAAIRKISSTGIVTTLAVLDTTASAQNGTGTTSIRPLCF